MAVGPSRSGVRKILTQTGAFPCTPRWPGDDIIAQMSEDAVRQDPLVHALPRPLPRAGEQARSRRMLDFPDRKAGLPGTDEAYARREADGFWLQFGLTRR